MQDGGKGSVCSISVGIEPWGMGQADSRLERIACPRRNTGFKHHGGFLGCARQGHRIGVQGRPWGLAPNLRAPGPDSPWYS